VRLSNYWLLETHFWYAQPLNTHVRENLFHALIASIMHTQVVHPTHPSPTSSSSLSLLQESFLSALMYDHQPATRCNFQLSARKRKKVKKESNKTSKCFNFSICPLLAKQKIRLLIVVFTTLGSLYK
jgi:hypothetical protein